MSRTLADTGQVIAIWRPPFSEHAARVQTFAPGCTLADLASSIEALPPDFDRRGAILIAGHEIDRKFWRQVRPKPGQRVTFHYRLAGGGDNGGKQVLGIVLAIATILTAGFAAAGGFAFLGGAFEAGKIGAQLLAGGISLVGSLAAAALTPPPANPALSGGKGGMDQQRGAAAVQGNVLSAGAPIPAVIGTYRVFPALAAQPLVERVGDDEYAEAIFCLSGPHLLENIRIGDSEISDGADIEYEIREGWADDQPIDLIRRYAVTQAPQLELSTPKVQTDTQDRLENQTEPFRSLPSWHGLRGSVGPNGEIDEFWFHLAFPAGLFQTSAANNRKGVAFRIRMRADPDDAWINLPELHYHSAEAKELRPSIVLKWGDGPESNTKFNSAERWVAAYKLVAGQTGVNEVSDTWTADSSFSAGSGSDGVYRGVESSSNVRRVHVDGDKCTIWLDEDAIPKGRYQFEIKRSTTYDVSSFSLSSYTYSGSARDFFHYYYDSNGYARVVLSYEKISDRCAVARFSSVVNEHPIFGGEPGSGLALIAIRARNRVIDNLSVLASGYVEDWDGSAWATWTTTKNPAPHYRRVLKGMLSPDPLPEAMIDNDSLVDWRAACATAGYTCSLVSEGDAIEELLNRIAGCGYARPRASETWGVIRDYDRSGEDPVQVFTSRNSSGLSMAKAFPRLPDAFRIAWSDAADEYAERQKLVWRPGRESTLQPRIEEIRFDGFDNETEATARAEYDLKQGVYRSSFWSFKAPAEAIRCTRGDLIGINHDAIDKRHASARIVDVDTDGGNVVGIWLDLAVPVYDVTDFLSVADLLAEGDVLILGMTSMIGIRRSDGVISYHAVDGPTGERDYVKLATPVAVADDDDDEPLIRPDCLVLIGSAGAEKRRMIVAGISYDPDLTASIVAVPEAPELFA